MTAKTEKNQTEKKQTDKDQYEIVTLVDANRYNFQSYVFQRNVPTKVRIGNAAYLLAQVNEDTDERFFSAGTVEISVGKLGRYTVKPVKIKDKDIPYMLTRVEQVYNSEKQKMEASLEGMPESVQEWTRRDFEAKHGPKKDKAAEA